MHPKQSTTVAMENSTPRRVCEAWNRGEHNFTLRLVDNTHASPANACAMVSIVPGSIRKTVPQISMPSTALSNHLQAVPTGPHTPYGPRIHRPSVLDAFPTY
jgi:hypothetical protein